MFLSGGLLDYSNRSTSATRTINSKGYYQWGSGFVFTTFVMYITTTMCDGVLHCFLFLMFFWCPYMAINVNVQYNGGFLPDIVLLTQCYLHRGTCLNAMKRFCICSL